MKSFVLILLFWSYVGSDDPWAETTTEMETTTSEVLQRFDCGTTCQNIDGCELTFNFETCDCNYNCASATETETTEDCTSPCPEPPSSFCSYIRVSSCTCDLVCCAPPQCEESGVDWEHCYSCDQCPCLPLTTTEPETISPPYCEDGWVPDWENCTPESCPCIPDISTETVTETTVIECTDCPLIPSSFCYNNQLADCTCEVVCCWPPQCEQGSVVDWANCYSCDHCPCLPETSTGPETTTEEETTTTTELYCGSTCEFKDGCVTSRNMQTCECLYDCPTTSAPSTKTKKQKCFAV